MTPAARKQNGQRRTSAPKKQGNGHKSADLWRTPPPLPPVQPIQVPTEVGAVLRSLGEPPTHNGAAFGHFVNTVVQRAAAVAFALAISVDLLDETGD